MWHDVCRQRKAANLDLFHQRWIHQFLVNMCKSSTKTCDLLPVTVRSVAAVTPPPSPPPNSRQGSSWLCGWRHNVQYKGHQFCCWWLSVSGSAWRKRTASDLQCHLFSVDQLQWAGFYSLLSRLRFHHQKRDTFLFFLSFFCVGASDRLTDGAALFKIPWKILQRWSCWQINSLCT